MRHPSVASTLRATFMPSMAALVHMAHCAASGEDHKARHPKISGLSILPSHRFKTGEDVLRVCMLQV